MSKQEIDQYTRIIEDPHSSDDDKAWAYYNRGYTYSLQEKYDLAVANFTEAIVLYTNNHDKAKAYNTRGNAYIKQEEYEEAVANFTEAIVLYTNNHDKAWVYLWRGIAYSRQGKYDFAMVDYGQAIKLHTDNNEKAWVYSWRGDAYSQQRKYDLAIEDYGQAIKLYTDDDDKAWMYSWRGIAYSEQKKYEEAIEDYGQTIELYTDDDDKARAYNKRGIAYSQQEKYDLAIEDYTQAISLGTKDDVKARTYNNRGDTYLKQKKYAEAIADHTQSIVLFTDNDSRAFAYYIRGIAYADQKKYDEAVQDFDKAIALNSYYAPLYVHRGILYLKNEKYENAIRYFNTALEQGIHNAEEISHYPKIRSHAPSQRIIHNEYVRKYQEQELINSDTLATNILAVFESVAKILNALKVEKNSEDTVEYLSHTTKLSVFTRHLMPTSIDAEPELGKFRMYHIAYANDPTEGTVLFNTLDIPHDEIEASTDISYVMVTSFCGGADTQALDNLPIWNMYGDNAKGIALLFKTQDLAYGALGNAIPTTLRDEPPQILYKVHYVNKDDKAGDKSDKAGDKSDEAVDEEIKNMKEYLKNIKEEDTQTLSVYKKTLELLSGVRYLIKDATYAYEKEYRLICFANERNIPDIVQREDPAKQNEETEDTQEQQPPRIYVETDILPKLCGVLTAPKLSKAQILDIQYFLHRYKQEKKLSYLKEQPIHTSTIPYR